MVSYHEIRCKTIFITKKRCCEKFVGVAQVDKEASRLDLRFCGKRAKPIDSFAEMPIVVAR